MRTIHPLHHRGRVAALIIDDQAILADWLTPADDVVVKAKCLEVLEIQAGERPGPYAREAAARYAERALRHRRARRSGWRRALRHRPASRPRAR